jgi:hypothetical protein
MSQTFSEGLAFKWINGKFGYMDESGTVVITPQFDGASNFSDGLALVNISGKSNYIDKSGKVVISSLVFSGAAKFCEGLAVVWNDLKYGYIDKTGRLAIDLQFDFAGHFSEGLARINIGRKSPFGQAGKWGYINKQGQVVIDPQFDDAEDFIGGLARVNKGGKRIGHNPVLQGGKNYYIDKNGKKVKEISG